MGVKSVARELLLCPYFKPNKDILRDVRGKHESLKDRVRKLLESKKVKCRDEVEVVLPVSGVKGRIDLVCDGDSRAMVVEIKSTRVTSLNLQDSLQLALYAYAYSGGSESSYRNLELILAYEGLGGRPVLFEITGGLKDVLFDIAKSVDGKLTGKGESSDTSKLRTLSPLCKICADHECLFRPR